MRGRLAEHHEGTFTRPEAILAWLVPVMEKCKGWTFPVEGGATVWWH